VKYARKNRVVYLMREGKEQSFQERRKVQDRNRWKKCIPADPACRIVEGDNSERKA
jgi:hypothetical protein